MTNATDTNRATYDRLWPVLADFIRHNPGARHRRRHVLQLAARCRFESVLDVGCGNAELLQAVDQAFAARRLMGVDLSSTVVEQNRRAVPQVEFAVCNVAAEALPGAFDLVICSEVIEHLDDPKDAIRNLADATSVGGHVIVTCPMGTLHATEKHFGHVRHPTPAQLSMWALDAGLVVQELWTWGFPVYALTKWLTNLKPEMALRQFGGDRPYGAPQRWVSRALYAANFANLRTSARGVQMFALLKKTQQRSKAQA